ncbi:MULTISPECIES: hypothetical protein [Pseudomonas]|jgi:hypothetical protein|uniref:Uncharacterized protein n=2 Tax=Pseudomonas fluorescens group TaxID=136843 RepID=A0AAW5AFV3_9PSED|nr:MULTISPECIES: hypothetical protein [Pseudomonas]KAA0943598.1 hypothetical protein FQ182_24365 [Pseudomonas sp. ANT_H4]KAA0946174.1 hypothetical protein FQ186_27315 [Pseudomonas sp. ANT_H14]KAA8706248.1 hypothetical protein F4W61_01055 [Pseudomonas proteolytica]MBA1222057.1 hypothetical protein [Pseudomonas fulva]MBI6557514.1 hypothetical protein [Pseudomonas veronii]
MQLRGERLKGYLNSKILELISVRQKEIGGYVYSQKEFSKYAGVSRETIRKYQSEIDACLRSCLVSKINHDGDAKYRNLQEKNHKLQREVVMVRTMYEAIRVQYIDLIEAMLSHSIDISILMVKPVGPGELDRTGGNCVLCGGSLDSTV